jgi:hypothetical protein
MNLDTPAYDERLSVLERELLESKRREEETQSALAAILQRIESLSLQNTSNLAPPPRTGTPAAPAPRSQLKASPPNEFSGDRRAGLSFLNSCKLYLSLCAEEFTDDQTKIRWALSYMKEGRAAQFSDRVLRREAYDQFPMFATWSDFEREFTTQFLPPHRNVDAANRLESTSFYQGKRTVEEYLDEFRYLIDEAGYEEGLGVVMKFRRGLNPSLQNQIATLGQGRPHDNEPEEWYAAARLHEQSRASNAAFINTRPTPVPARPLIPARPNPFIALRPPAVPSFQRTHNNGDAPNPSSARPVPMDVDAVRKRSTTTLSCHRCGELGHFAKDCARRFDVRYMTTDEQEEWIQRAMVAKDVAEVEQRTVEEQGDVIEDFGVDNE